MGCNACSNMCSDDVKFEQVDMKISKKNCETIARYSNGAAARREAKKVAESYLQEITGKFLTFSTILLRTQKALLPGHWKAGARLLE